MTLLLYRQIVTSKQYNYAKAYMICYCIVLYANPSIIAFTFGVLKNTNPGLHPIGITVPAPE